MRLTNLHHNLAKVIRMPTPLEQAHITYRAWLLALRALLEAILLYIAYGLHEECNHEKDDSDDVRGLPETRLMIVQYLWTIQDRDWQTDDPYPEHLKDPEPKEWEELIPLVVKSIVLASLQNPEEQEAREAGGPEHDKDAGYNLSSIGRAAHGES